MLENINELVPQGINESERDYTIFIDFCKSNKNLKEFSKTLDITYGSLRNIAYKNKWIKRRNLVRDYTKLQNLNDKQFFIEMGTNGVMQDLIKLNNTISKSLLEDIDNYSDGDKNEIANRLNKNMSTLSEGIRISRLIAGLSDKNVMLDNVISQLNEPEEEDINDIYNNYEKLLEEDNE